MIDFFCWGYNSSARKRDDAMDNHHLLNAISRVSTLGVTLVSSIAVGMFLGHLLDSWLNSSPWGIIAGILLGIVAGFYGILKIVLANQDR